MKPRHWLRPALLLLLLATRLLLEHLANPDT